MGQNLILNIADNGFTVVAFNRTVSKVDHFLENEAKGKSNQATGTSVSNPLNDSQVNQSLGPTRSRSSFPSLRNPDG